MIILRLLHRKDGEPVLCKAYDTPYVPQIGDEMWFPGTDDDSILGVHRVVVSKNHILDSQHNDLEQLNVNLEPVDPGGDLKDEFDMDTTMMEHYVVHLGWVRI